MKHNLIDSNNNMCYNMYRMYLTVDSLMDINNTITGSNNISLRNRSFG